MRRACALTAVLAALALAACGEEEAPSPPSRDPEAGATAPAARPDPAGGECERVERPAPKEVGDLDKPDELLDSDATYEATVRTSCGEFTIELDVKSAPKTSASFVALAEKGFFDGLTFHRIVPGFVIQGGDPDGTGEGGPGYETVDRPPEDATYEKGVVAMAKAADEDPGTAGSQFFVVTAEDSGLPAEYAVLGKVTRGLDVVERIGRLGDPSDESGAPTRVVVIESISVEES